MGRIDPKKGIENLINAIMRLPSHVLLRVCGTGNEAYVRSLHALANRINLSERIEFAGHVSGHAKAQAFVEADVCVVPSFTENFGNVVAEALAHGTPVIASVGTPWQALEERRAGKWVQNDPESLAAAVAELESADLAAMGERGRAWMRSEYSWDRISEDMLGAYANLIERSRELL
jgi:glycosyltransferase involved in cell wall biosynthesis